MLNIINNKTIILLLFFILISSIASVSAIDENNCDIKINYDSSLISDYESQIYVNNSNNQYLPDGSYDAPYYNLKDAIANADDNSTIILMDGIYGGESNANLIINKNLTIKSLSDATIDGQDKYAFFNVLKSNTLILDNLKFINGYTNVDSSQLAVISNQGNLIINSTTFTKMDSFMGLIFNGGNLTIDNSNFKSVTSQNLAQIITNIENCTISNSVLPYRQDYLKTSLTVYNYYNLAINNSTIGSVNSNYDYDDNNYRKLSFTSNNSNFTSLEFINGTVIITDSVFSQGLRFTKANVSLNRVNSYSSYQFTSSLTVSNSTLMAKSSVFNSGINCFDSKINITYSVIYGQITGNGISSEVYAPFNWWGDNNGPKIYYAKINANNWIIMTFNSTVQDIPIGTTNPFTVALNKYTDGIYVNLLDNPSLLPNRYVTFEAQNGLFLTSGAYLEEGIFNNYLINNNESSLVYAIIDSQRLRLVIGTGLTDYELYVSPTKGHNGYGDGSYESPYQTLDFTISKALNGNTIYLLDGVYRGALNANLIINKNITVFGLENAILKRDNDKNIFQIQNWGNLIIKNITFTVDNDAYANPLFISNGGNLTIYNSTFKDIESTAIINANGIVKIFNSVFIDNRGSLLTGSAKTYIYNSVFENMNAHYTNVIYRDYNYIIPTHGSVEIYNSIFSKNNMGIINLQPTIQSNSRQAYKDYSRYAYIENTSFIENRFVSEDNSYYTNGMGLKIYASSGAFGGFIDNCTFIKNYGPIANLDTIDSSVFISNQRAYVNALNVNNSYFENNINLVRLGNSYQGNGIVASNNVFNSTFINNSAAYGGALYNPKEVHYSVFVNNSAFYQGNDIFSYSGDVDYSSNWWGDNQKPDSNKIYLFLGNLKLDDWIIMTLINSSSNVIQTSLNTLMDNDKNTSPLDFVINQRPVSFWADYGSVHPQNTELTNNVASTIIQDKSSNDFNVYAKIDNQVLDLTIRNNSTTILMENRVFYGRYNSYNLTLINVNGYRIVNQTLNVEIVKDNGEAGFIEVKTDENAYAEFAFEYPVGKYIINVYYGGNGYFNPSNNSAAVNVLASPTYLIASNQVYYGKNNNFNIILNDVGGRGVLNKTIKFKITDSYGNYKIIESTTDSFGKAEIYLDLDVGTYIIESTFNGDGWYSASAASSSVTVRPVNSTIQAPTLTLYGTGNIYNITLRDSYGSLICGENIEVIISQNDLSDKFILRTDENGVAHLTINYLPGTYNLKASYLGDNVYGSAENISVITVEKVLTILSGFHYITIPMNGIYTVVLSDIFGRKLANETICLNLYKGSLLKSYSGVSDGNGEVTFIINENEGTYLATFDYGGNVWYFDSTNAATIIIDNQTTLEEVSLNGSDLAQYYGEGKYFVISFNDPNAFSQYGKNIQATITGSTFIQSYDLITDAFGQARLQINLNPGVYNITYKYSNSYYHIFAEKSNKILVYNMPTNIYASDMILKTGQSKYMEIYLKDVNNNPLANMQITVDINGSKYDVTTNTQGIGRLLINKDLGSYMATFSFTNPNYISSNGYSTILIVDSNKIQTSVESIDKVFYDNETIEYVVSLKDLLANGIPSSSIIIDISTTDNEFINSLSVNTNASGDALFKFKLSYGNYLVNAYYKGSSDYLESSKISYIQVLPSNNLTESILIGRVVDNIYVVNLMDENAKPLADKQVILNINNQSYSLITNDDGEAYLNLTLNSGMYNLIATFNGDKFYQKVSIQDKLAISGNLTYLFALDLVKYYRNASQFHAQLLDNLGNPLVNKSIILNINGINYTRSTDLTGWITFNVNLEPGEYDMICSYYGDAEDENAFDIAKITVLSTIIGQDLVKYYRNASQFHVKLLQGNGSAIANTYVSLNLSGEIHVVKTNNDGIASLNINSELGNYILTVQNPYDELIKSFKITVLGYSTLKDTHMQAKLNNGIYEISLLDDNSNPVTEALINVLVNNDSYTVISDDVGKIAIDLGGNIGIYNIEAIFKGNGAYDKSTFSDSVIVSGNLTYLFSFDLVKYYRNASQFHAQLVNSLGNPLPNKNISLNINGADYKRVTDENGWINFNINLNPGEYYITCSYFGDNQLENAFNRSKITVLPTIFGNNLIKFYRNSSQFHVKIIDWQGNPANGENITMNINGVFYTRTTNDDGIAILNINLNPGEYILTALNPYGGYMKSFNITVLPTIMGQNIVKYYKNDTQYHVRLLDDLGNPLANANVEININGVFYTRTTNDDGIAILNINLNPGEYVLTAKHPNSLMCSNTIKILPILSASDLKMNYKDGSKFKVKLLNNIGLPFYNQNITFNINGIFYNRLTDGDGMASLNINLQSGEYIISSIYNGYTIANTITIS